ncbi:hypothetical protein BCR32DRAFT_247893 [Anaeromyces robustus]|uniref:Uncharacterized protein n=1 Tax=Anaeromyces robustus TaxID=1754192 RepID=A0A1Y1WV94_9FUNG|nr:hypothetical protein BCR32DRAFT_247893 [Anaeromyces robustus]|eukprot:ORX77467.1 hypothetical protein BCR32DRAFT_247893 [Anaeromyces robustus]
MVSVIYPILNIKKRLRFLRKHIALEKIPKFTIDDINILQMDYLIPQNFIHIRMGYSYPDNSNNREKSEGYLGKNSVTFSSNVKVGENGELINEEILISWKNG